MHAHGDFEDLPYFYVPESFTNKNAAEKLERMNCPLWKLRLLKDGYALSSLRFRMYKSYVYESNARFVRWSDGSLQLLIGNEVLDISVQDAQHGQAHLFLRHGKGILQSQGIISRKMRFLPSSLSSNSYRLLTALVDGVKRFYKVKNCVTDIDPEREKEEEEKAESQNIRANVLLNRKRETVNQKYTQTVDRRRQLSTGYLEDALEEIDLHLV
ncbi:hypothetical protein LWI29_024255 [Acer saccharum]|uniref:Uncharacterized protein n=1 Tax=Acer saccharum TaxID=4024 RepID=A0AA39W7L1_ACESA|nr:hypothetical protein LWI29_024255 [Acer saccharum]